jgi:hypothetical protein
MPGAVSQLHIVGDHMCKAAFLFRIFFLHGFVNL